MTTTPNYSWPLIENTDFVTNLPADLETLADAIDDTVKDLNPGTTAGDVDYYTSGTAKARLAIGTAGQVLTVNSGATAPEWANAASGDSTWTLLNAGGTALTGAQTITVSGITNADKLLIVIEGASSASVESTIAVRINTDTGSNYYTYGMQMRDASSWNVGLLGNINGAQTSIFLAQTPGTSAAGTASAYCFITGGKTAGVKAFHGGGGGETGTNYAKRSYIVGGYWDSASTITSVSAFSSVGNFDAGTLRVYKG